MKKQADKTTKPHGMTGKRNADKGGVSKERLTVSVGDLLPAIREAAEGEGESPSEWVRGAIRERLERG